MKSIKAKDLRISMKQSSKKELEQIPGVGEAIAQDMQNIGISSVAQLKGRDPEKLYQKLCDFKASPVDRCMLYVLRCAIYYASNTEHDPDLLKWWNWKDKSC
jgi:hypothetical protein